MGRELKPCPSWAAYKRHLYNSEQPCDDCIAAQRVYMRTWRPLKPSSPLPPHGTVATYWRHRRSGETPCESCRRAFNAYQRECYAANRAAVKARQAAA